VEGLTRLIEDLRVVGLADNGYLEVQIQSANLAEEIKADACLFEPGLQACGFVLHLDLLERPVQCDPARIRQALLAMLDNLKRHATPGNVTVRLGNQDGLNTLSVADEGPGIAEAFATHIFEPFQRGESSRSRAQGGSGLGLAVVRAIALSHGGRATCRNLDNGGTLFELSWPDQLVAI
jgi:two-component system sensor histidine kinase AdeS